MSSRAGFWVRVSVRVCALAQLGGQGSGCWEVAGFHPRGVQGRSLATNRAPHSDQPSHQRLSITDDRMPKSRPSLQAGETTQNAYPKNRRSGMPFSYRKGSESASRISISSPRGLPCLCAHSVVSVWPHGLQPARLLCPWDFSGQNTGASSRFLLQGIFPCQGSNPRLLCLPRWQADSLPLSHRGSLFLA